MNRHSHIFFGALVEQQRTAEAAALMEVGERTRQAVRSVRATLAQLEQDLLGQEPWPGITVGRRLDPALMTAPRPSTPGLLTRYEAELEDQRRRGGTDPRARNIGVGFGR